MQKASGDGTPAQPVWHWMSRRCCAKIGKIGSVRKAGRTPRPSAGSAAVPAARELGRPGRPRSQKYEELPMRSVLPASLLALAAFAGATTAARADVFIQVPYVTVRVGRPRAAAAWCAAGPAGCGTEARWLGGWVVRWFHATAGRSRAPSGWGAGATTQPPSHPTTRHDGRPDGVPRGGVRGGAAGRGGAGAV